MPAGGETLVCGVYTVTYNSLALGLLKNDDGLPTLELTNEGEDITGDAYGRSVIDGIYQGGNAFIGLTCEEYKAATLAAWWPFSSRGRMGLIGRLHYDMALPLVLTAVAGTPAASSPATLTATRAFPSPGTQRRVVFGPTLRTLPLRWRLYPYSSGGNVVWYTET